MKKTKTFAMMMPLMVVLGVSAVSAHAQTWTWDSPAPVVKTPAIAEKLTELAAGTKSDLLYGIAGGVAVAVTTGTAVTPSANPLAPGSDQTKRDLTVGFQKNVYVITDTAVASWTSPSTYTPLDSQPSIPEGTTGTFTHITTGKTGKLFVLYEITANGSQYILVGNPPATSITATVRFSPRTLNLKSNGNWVTCRIGLQNGYSVKDIDLDTICISSVDGNDKITPIYRDTSSPVGSGKTLMVKFSRQELVDLLTSLLPQTDGKKVDVTLTVSGFGQKSSTSEYFRFSGTDTIAVKTDGK